MNSSHVLKSQSDLSEREYLDRQENPSSPGGAKALKNENHRLRIKKIKETWRRDPTEFELLALNVLPLPPSASAHLTTPAGVNIKCGKKAFQLLLNCEFCDDINGVHKAGSLLQPLNTESSLPDDQSTMSSAFSDSHSQDIPNGLYDEFGTPGDPLVNTSMPSSATHGLATNTYDCSHNPSESNCPQYPPAAFDPVYFNPSPLQSMAEIPKLSYGNGFGPAKPISPSKRVFSSPYINSNAMVTSELNHTPSPKRRAGLPRSGSHISIDNTGLEETVNAPPLQRMIAKQRPRRATTSTVVQAANIVIGATGVKIADEPQDFSKYYQFLAEKNNLQGFQMHNGGNASSSVYISPYKSTNSPSSPSQQQHTRSARDLSKASQESVSIAAPAAQSARRCQPDQHCSSPQHSTRVSMRSSYNGTEAKARQRTEAIRDLQKTKIETMRQRRANPSTLMGQRRVQSLTSSNSTQDLCMPHLSMDSNVCPTFAQSGSIWQYSYGSKSQIEPGQHMGENHEKSLGPDSGFGGFNFGDSAQHGMEDTHEHAFDSTQQSMASNSPAAMMPQARPRTDINKILPEYRQDYSAYEEKLMDGNQTQTNLPPWLVIRAKKKAGVLPSALTDSDSESDDDCAPLPPKPAPYLPILETAETGPLPNINQPYTGTLNPSSIHLAAHLSHYGPPTPQMSVQNPHNISSEPKKKKTSTPSRKSRAKKASQSENQVVTPPAVNPQAAAHDFSFPANENQVDKSTLDNMMAGNFAQFFTSPEEEAKWKQDAVAAAMAEQDTPSKRQLKLIEQQRKKLEKESKAKH